MFYRQGDVLLEKVGDNPEDVENKINISEKQETDSYVVAEGEVTGHKHKVEIKNTETEEKKPGDMTIFNDENGNTYLFTPEPATVTHEEHDTIELEPGTYKVGEEREHDYFSQKNRKVVD